MTVSSYIKRQSRTRTRKTTLPLTSIVEEPISEEPAPKPKRNSDKARRRLGVSNLFIPRNSTLFTAVQGDPDSWRLTLQDSLDTYDFPRPPPFDEGESSGSGSGSDTASCSSPASSGPATPSPSPTRETHSLLRCKSIKPLTITKRALSPAPPPAAPSNPASSSAAPASPDAPEVEEVEEEEEEAWEDDDEYYAAHARAFITLARPLPPSFPTSLRALNRESTVFPAFVGAPTPAPHRASVRLSRTISIPARAPPPPPIITSRPQGHSRSSSSTSINYSLPMATRPPPPTRLPPRTPVPMDAMSGDYASDYAAYLPLLRVSPTPSSSSSRLDSLLSPRFPAETQGVPADVDIADDGWEECDFEEEGYDEVPLSPLVAPSPASEEPSPIDECDATEPVDQVDAEVAELAPALQLPPYTGWHPRPRASQLQLALAASSPIVPSPSPSPSPSPAPPHCASPQLRSRWSSSTLSSVHSAHALRSPASPKTFAFARRYFPRPAPKSAPSSSYSNSNNNNNNAHYAPAPRVRPMGATTSAPKPPPKKRGKKLTVDDVVVVGRPAEPSVLACASPDVFASPQMHTPFLSPASVSASPFRSPASALSPVTPSTQWASYPASPSPSPAHAHSHSYDASPSPSRAYAARRRASTASSATGWSYSSSSTSGESACSGESAGSGLRRKPIPVEMFLR
ncbi:hypothetical protein B0H17DRAFT_642777 [Mycena rosella]|uniref:Uncharacterized protein n=1 Tax=Mycena rosella TaxID=1033263 RepID=A0AAD7GHF3_MYCRO|nr:hypothetical protein B0H17DRAFT_642777 [Mycena rosella]